MSLRDKGRNEIKGKREEMKIGDLNNLNSLLNNRWCHLPRMRCLSLNRGLRKTYHIEFSCKSMSDD